MISWTMAVLASAYCCHRQDPHHPVEARQRRGAGRRARRPAPARAGPPVDRLRGPEVRGRPAGDRPRRLALQGQLYGMGGRELKRRGDELLDRFGLAEAANRQARTYSGGMQRKLDVAMGLVHRPRALFLEEPTTGLDPEARADMWEEISRLAGEGLTILLT